MISVVGEEEEVLRTLFSYSYFFIFSRETYGWKKTLPRQNTYHMKTIEQKRILLVGDSHMVHVGGSVLSGENYRVFNHGMGVMVP